MQTVLIVIHLMVVLALIGVVLIQRSEGGGLGIGGGGGGGGGGFFTARGTANVLTRATAILAAIFFVTSLSLTVLAGWGRTPPALLNQPGLPTGPAVPQSGGSILDQIRPQAPASTAPAPRRPLRLLQAPRPQPARRPQRRRLPHRVVRSPSDSTRCSGTASTSPQAKAKRTAASLSPNRVCPE
ncbi:MAG: preprotein translocase subunit SecG [Rhizobiales bacterium 12-68-15]|nr:MAG: preprotein translocase subunit SecG [Rhizobiales bacterium 12-68-15]